jgi:hypothetical protein
MTSTDLSEPAAPWPPPGAPAPPPADAPAGSQPPPVGPEAGAPERRRPFDGATARLAVVALASGVALDIGIRGGPANVVVVTGLALAVVAFVVDRHVARAQARWLALAALAPAAFLAVRVSPWLIASNLAAAAGLATAAVCLAQSGSLLDTTPMRLLHRRLTVLEGVLHRLVAPRPPGRPVVRPPVPRVSSATTKRALRIGLALAITLPLLLAIGALLASADAVFAGMFSPDIDPAPTLGHVVLTLIAATGVVCAVVAGRGDSDRTLPPGRFGTVEVAIMLGLATVVMALFAVAQLVAATSAGDRLIEDAGLTPAEYARSGFFQLCWAAALIVAFLALVRGLAAPGVLDRPAIRALGAAVPLLALGLVVVSLRRMALYDEAFGLTMLRLWVVGAAVWMALVLLMIAARNLGLGAGRDWVLGGAVGAALVLVLVADVADPEAFVVRHNVDRAGDGVELDAAYLARLSDDAVPAYADAVRTAPAPLRAELLSQLPCDEDATGVAALNLSARRAADARDEVC